MRPFMGWAVSAVSVIAVAAAAAQPLLPSAIGGSPYSRVSDIGGRHAAGPYGAMPEGAMPPRYAEIVLTHQEVYAVVREHGFSPLSAPQQRGAVYTVAVIDPNGEDGRLVIDARDGRIIRFLSAYQMGDRMDDEVTMSFGPPDLPPPDSDTVMRPVQRPPVAVPHLASRSPNPLMRTTPSHPAGEAKPSAPATAAVPALVQQSAVVPARPAETARAAPAPEVKPSIKILPTQEMPRVQGLD